MSETIGNAPDPLDGLLRPTSLRDGDDLRRRLLDQTTRSLRRRRRRRVLAWAAALAACYVAGLLTMYAAAPRRVEVVVRDATVPPPSAPTSPVSSPPDAAATSALALEWKAFDADKPRPDLYRQAGDRYLREDADPASALRCYGRSLDGAAAKDLAISPDDDYLLMLVKEARQKEKDHAKNGG